MKKQYVHVFAVCVAVAALGLGTMVYAQVPASATGTAMSAAAAKKARLQEAVMGMERSLEARIAGLEGLAGRIQSRMGKMQAEGKDMVIAVAKFAEAQKRIAEAKAELANLKKANAAMVASAKPATAFGNIKNKLAKNVAVKIKDAHKALVDTVVIMKGQRGSATSSASIAQ